MLAVAQDRLTNFSVVRPVRSKQPVGRPSSTSPRHMRDVEHEKTVGVCVVTDQPHRRPTFPAVWPLIGGIDTNLGGVAICHRDETVLVCRLLVDILDVSVGRVVARVEVKFVEEDRRLVVVNQLVRASSRRTVTREECCTRDTLRRSERTEREGSIDDARPRKERRGPHRRLQSCSAVPTNRSECAAVSVWEEK